MDEGTSLTDDVLEREVAALLNVQPSAAFEARVRARVAAEEPRILWRRRWAWAVLPAAGLAAAAGLMLRLSPPPDMRVVPAPPAVAKRAPAPLMPAPASPASAPRDTPDAPATARVNRDPGLAAPAPLAAPAALRASVLDLPEVVVSEDEVRTFQRLVALSQQESQRPEPPPAEITAGNRGTIHWPALAFETVAIEAPALDNLTLE